MLTAFLVAFTVVFLFVVILGIAGFAILVIASRFDDDDEPETPAHDCGAKCAECRAEAEAL